MAAAGGRRKASTEKADGNGVTPDAGKGKVAAVVDTSTNAGRMTVVVQNLNAITRDADDDSRSVILAVCEKVSHLLAKIVAT